LDGGFDLVFDRGMLHTLAPALRPRYAEVVPGLLRPGGWLLLKCFSVREPPRPGPFRFAPDDIRALLGDAFEVVSIEESVYHGALDPYPKALMCRLRRR
jgi:hypothetical protein